jgi:hypothetical protein
MTLPKTGSEQAKGKNFTKNGPVLLAAHDPAAFDVAISNLIEVTQTRSAYGEVMNKRAAVGSVSSDTNGRSGAAENVFPFFEQRFSLNTIDLTRQARDKHRES